jgi:hypothetical protein
MLPEILDSLEDLIDTMVPLFSLVVIMLGAYGIVRAWRRGSPSREALESIDDKLTQLLETSDVLREELGEIQDRVEFTERLLTKAEARETKPDG